MDEINRRRLEWMANAHPGAEFPAELFVGSEDGYTGWSKGVRSAAQAALDELATYRGIKVIDDVVHIDGIKYARSMFEGIGLKTPLRQWIRIIERSSDGVVCIETQTMPTWQPIETAPVAPWTPELPSYYLFRCLLQVGDRGYVTEGAGYWVTPAKHIKRDPNPKLRWRCSTGQCFPTHWMPLPAPFNEPVNEPLNEDAS